MNDIPFFEHINYNETLFPINFKFIHKMDDEERSILPLLKYVKKTAVQTSSSLVLSAYSPICKIIMPYE